MTDTHTTPTAARIAGSLSEQERAALELAANGNENIDFVVWQELQIKGLIDYDEGKDTDFLTPKGKQVLATLVPVSAEPTDEVLREALQFYANPDNWHLTWNPERDQPINVIDEDGGKLAASVLAAGQQASGQAAGVLPEAITAAEWNTVKSAWQQGKAVIRDKWGDITVDITPLPKGEFSVTDVYGETWIVDERSGSFKVEWFTMPDPLPNAEDLLSQDDGENLLVELFNRVLVRLEYVQNLTVEGYSLEEETRLEKWIDNSQDYLPMWYQSLPEIPKRTQLPATPTPVAIWAQLSVGEREALRSLSNGLFVDTPELNSLLQKKLFTWEYPDWQTHKVVMSALGAEVLAAGQPASGGGEATEGVAHFIGYRLDYALEECEDISELLAEYENGFTIEQVIKDLDNAINKWQLKMRDPETLRKLVEEFTSEYIEEDYE